MESTHASPWRGLFAGREWPDLGDSPALLSPLKLAFAQLGPRPDPLRSRDWQPQLVDALRALDLPAGRISQLLSDHNDWLYRYCIEQALAEMRAQGWGEPPVGFCVLTLGSGARHESLLGPDQDNAMILEDYPDSRHLEVDTWFQSLGERFTARLGEAGISLCKGHVMARWPLWRKRLGAWQAQLQIWTGRRTVKLVQLCNILFDFYPVYGQPLLAERLRQTVYGLMPKAGLFLDEMAELLEEVPVAIDRFDRLAGDDKDAPHRHAINLKRQGLLPLQSAVRLLSLVEGVREVDTRQRLRQLAGRGVIGDDQRRALDNALERLQGLLLEAQLASLAAGRTADGWVDERTLGETEKALLRLDLRAIREAQRRARSKVPRTGQ